MSIASYLLALVPLAALAICWPSMPATVPVHIGFDGRADRWGSKSELLIVGIVLTVLFLLMAAALQLRSMVPHTDQDGIGVSAKGRHRGMISTFLAFTLLEITVDVIFIVFFGIAATVHAHPINFGRIISAGAGSILIIIGNIAPLLSTPGLFGLHIPNLRFRPKTESFVSRSAGISTLLFGVICVMLSFIVPLQYCGIMAFLCYISSFVLIIVFWIVASRTIHDD
ncbi:DUF1648 domain-containing protein [Bifidobacterium oedipodis]|nr:DUF1648 domain-containing protein [Bifidobacterium sp. DSM 109957]